LQPTRWLRDGSQGRAQDNMKRRDVEAPPIIALPQEPCVVAALFGGVVSPLPEIFYIVCPYVGRGDKTWRI